MSKYFRWLELLPREDVYAHVGTTRWGNHDLYPIPMKERTYTTLSFFAYWLSGGIGIVALTFGSSFIASGLNAAETICAILVGSCLASSMALLNCRPGTDMGLGYVSLLFTKMIQYEWLSLSVHHEEN